MFTIFQTLTLRHVKSVVAVHGIYGDREDTWMTEETDNQPKTSWLKQIHEDYPSSRIMTFGYDASHPETGLYTMGRIRDRALQLLDDLIKLRRGKNLVPVCILLIIDPSVRGKQRANLSYRRIPVVRYYSSVMIWEVLLSKW